MHDWPEWAASARQIYIIQVFIIVSGVEISSISGQILDGNSGAASSGEYAF